MTVKITHVFSFIKRNRFNKSFSQTVGSTFPSAGQLNKKSLVRKGAFIAKIKLKLTCTFNMGSAFKSDQVFQGEYFFIISRNESYEDVMGDNYDKSGMFSSKHRDEKVYF